MARCLHNHGAKTMTTDKGPRFPNIEVQLTGEDGNSFRILGAVQVALRAAGVPRETIAEFEAEATSGDRDHLLITCMRWVTVL
jgi:hypothetical protein